MDSKQVQSLVLAMEDKNIHFPLKPKLQEDVLLYMIPHGLGIYLTGGSTTFYLRCDIIEELYTFFLENVNGRNTLSELRERCPNLKFEYTLLHALYLLHTKGYLTNSENIPQNIRAELDVCNARQNLFWGRKLNITKYNSTPEVVQKRLERAHIAIIGSGMLGRIVDDILQRSGCKNLKYFNYSYEIYGEPQNTTPSNNFSTYKDLSDALLHWLSTRIDQLDIVITATRLAPKKIFKEINAICLDNRIPWLRCNEDGMSASIGPLVLPYESACVECLQIKEQTTEEFPIEDSFFQQFLQENNQNILIGESIPTATHTASIVALEVVRFISGLTTPITLNAVLELDLLNGITKIDPLNRVPGCPECSKVNF